MKAYWYDNVEVTTHQLAVPGFRRISRYSPPRNRTNADVICLQGDQREPHDSGRAVSEEKLASLGVLYKHCPTIAAVDAIAAERGYRNRDEVCVSPATMGAIYEEKVKSFFSEHLHEDEEIRYILDGEGYFDVRGQEDEWIRIDLVKEDMIILPAGIYHRFTTNEQNVCCFGISVVVDYGTDVVCSTLRPCVFSKTSLSGRH